MTALLTPPRQKQATLARWGRCLFVRPAVPAIATALTGLAHRAIPHPAHGYAVGRTRNQLYQIEEDDAGRYLVTGAGMEPVVRRVLAAEGRSVAVTGPPVKPLPTPGLLTPKLFPCADLEVLKLVQRCQEGLVRYRQHTVEPARLIAQIALAWPNLRVAVAVTRIEEARAIRNQLHRYVPTVVAISSRNRPPQAGRVIVATYLGLGHPDVAIENLDVLVALDAQEATGDIPADCLSHAHRARLLGFLDDSVKLAPLEEDRLRMMFGFDEVKVQAHGQVEPSVRVIPARMHLGFPSPAVDDVLALKRTALWHNDLRNRLIAKLAKAATKGTPHAILDSAQVHSGQPQTVAVYVENLEHARALSKHLPGWPVIGTSPIRTGREQPKGLRTGNGQGQELQARDGDRAPETSVVASLGLGDRGQDQHRGGDRAVGAPPAIVTAAAPGGDDRKNDQQEGRGCKDEQEAVRGRDRAPGAPPAIVTSAAPGGQRREKELQPNRGCDPAPGAPPMAIVTAAALGGQRRENELQPNRGCDPAPGTPPMAIVTAAAPPGSPFSGPVDLLIRADAGPGVPPWVDSLVQDGNGNKPLILVDLIDRQHRQLRQWSWRRQEAYDARGWPGPESTLVEARVDDFLARRPQGGQR